MSRPAYTQPGALPSSYTPALHRAIPVCLAPAGCYAQTNPSPERAPNTAADVASTPKTQNHWHDHDNDHGHDYDHNHDTDHNHHYNSDWPTTDKTTTAAQTHPYPPSRSTSRVHPPRSSSDTVLNAHTEPKAMSCQAAILGLRSITTLQAEHDRLCKATENLLKSLEALEALSQESSTACEGTQMLLRSRQDIHVQTFDAVRKPNTEPLVVHFPCNTLSARVRVLDSDHASVESEKGRMGYNDTKVPLIQVRIRPVSEDGDDGEEQRLNEHGMVPWSKDFPSFWEGGDPAGLGRW